MRAVASLLLRQAALLPFGAAALLAGLCLHFDPRPGLSFAYPAALAGLVLVPLLALSRDGLLRWQRPRVVRGNVQTTQARRSLRPWVSSLESLALLACIIALAGPRHLAAGGQEQRSGIDVLFALDVSLSMQASDIQPNRFQALQAVVDAFVARRPRDRIGAVVFGREAYTLMPLTVDHIALRNTIRGLELGNVDGRGTAIGNAVGLALNRLKPSDAASRVVILLTDGESNSGNLAPAKAAAFAEELGVKLYTILMGRDGKAAPGSGDLFNRVFGGGQEFPVNPDLLRKMAEQTGGRFFQVGDRASLERTFHEILDKLKRSEIQDEPLLYHYAYAAPLWLALISWLGAALLREFYGRPLP